MFFQPSRYKFKYIQLSFTIVILILLSSCANKGTPTGGKYDLDPPKLVSITPKMNATNVSNVKTIIMLFDENVQLDTPTDKVIVTPPQRIAPTFTTINRKIKVQLSDSLIPNTTYVMDFTDALADMNEKNVLENFVVTFATGDKIDSMQISGKVLAAENLEPVSGIYVGLHTNIQDSAFTNTAFERISKTDSRGRFTIRGVRPNKYRLFALKDANRDFKYDSPAEDVAFMDSLIVPSFMPATKVDTVFKKDKKTVDSLVTKSYTRFLPDNIILRSFTSSFKKQFLQKYDRPKKQYFNLMFGGPTRHPDVEVLNAPATKQSPFLEERDSKNDSIKYWITDPQVLSKDTLVLKVKYTKSDTLNITHEKTDTIKIYFRDFKAQKKKGNDKDKDKNKKTDFLKVNNNASGGIDIPQIVTLEFEEPVMDFAQKKLVLSQKKDSTLLPVQYSVTQDSLNPRKYSIFYKWKPGGEYQLHADSAAFSSYYGRSTDKLDIDFKVKTEEDYGAIFINIHSLPANTPAFVELLDKSDKPIRTNKVKKDGVLFKYLNPGTYYARIILDKNDNGVWDTGEFAEDRQPELVYYYDKSFEVKANWDIEEDWDLTKLPLDKQKPLDITKNKPQEKKTKRQQLEEAEKKKQSKNSSYTTTSTTTSSTSN